MKVSRLTLSLPTPENALHRGAGRTRHKSAEYKAWIAVASTQIMIERAARSFTPIESGWYSLRILWPARDRADADGRGKALIDILHRMGVTPDDRHLWSHDQSRSWAVEPGTCTVEFWATDDSETAPPHLAS